MLITCTVWNVSLLYTITIQVSDGLIVYYVLPPLYTCFTSITSITYNIINNASIIPISKTTSKFASKIISLLKNSMKRSAQTSSLSLKLLQIYDLQPMPKNTVLTSVATCIHDYHCMYFLPCVY